ncbi:MAG: potassium channel family protein, partial [Planctomycetota bacterium]
MILSLLILVAIGTTGYRLLEGMNTIDAVYMTIITVSTVGYGEVKPLSSIGRVGQNVAHELKAEGLPFVVVDPNLEKITC